MELNKDYVEDLQGTHVKPGDTIVYGATDGRSGGIRIGKVVKINPPARKPRWRGDDEGHLTTTKLVVEVKLSSGYDLPGKNTSIDATLKRFVKMQE